MVLSPERRNLAIALFSVLAFATWVMVQVPEFVSTGSVYLGLGVLSYLGLDKV